MTRPRFLKSIWAPGTSSTNGDRTGRRKWRQAERFTLEALESRTLLSTITEYSVPNVAGASAAPAEITSIGGKLWFTDEFGNAIGMTSPSSPASVQAYSQGLAGTVPLGIATGSDGNIWFTEPAKQSIGILSTANPSAAIHQFDFTTLSAPLNSAFPAGITSGPDGNIWFTDSSNNAIGKITVTANPANDTVTEFPVPAGNVGFASFQSQIISGPGGKLYFTEVTFNADHTVSKSAIGSYNPASNTWGESALLGAGQQPFGLTVGPDQNVWLTEAVPTTVAGTFSSSAIEAIAPTQATPPVIALIPTTTPAGGATPEPYRITAGPDGALWFSDTANGAIGIVKLASGTITMFPIPKTATFTNPKPQGITVGPDGNIWFTDFSNAVGVVTLSTQAAVTAQPTTTDLNLPFNVGVSVTYTDSGNGYNGNATISLATGPAGATLGGPALTVPVTNGVANFSGLTLNKVGSNYTLKVVSGAASTTTSAINVVNASATQLVITSPGTVAAGTLDVTVKAEDSSNTVDPNYNGTVTLTITPGGTVLTTAAVNGVATFSVPALSLPGGYTLQASAAGLTSPPPTSVTIVPAAASHFLVSVQPITPVGVGSGFGATVVAYDQFGNVATNFNGVVNVALSTNPGVSIGTAMASNGVATFSGLTVSHVGTYALVISATGLPSVTTASFTATAPAPTVIREVVLFTQKRNKKGKPIGKPVFAGFEFDFSTTMNAATTAKSANYQVGKYVTKRVKRKTVKVLQTVGSSVSFNASNNSAIVSLIGKPTFPKGGQITLVATAGGITSLAGVSLDGNGDGTGGDNGTFTITVNAKGITHS